MINPNEAPPGYKAKLDAGVPCKDCEFKHTDKCIAVPCLPEQRKDNASVVFIAEEDYNEDND